MGKIKIIRGLITVFVLSLWLLPSAGKAATILVDCDSAESLQDAINGAGTRDTIEVSGTCNENISLREQKRRITLDGQGTATINGAATTSTINVRGRGHTIKGFTISGGTTGIFVNRGGTVLIGGTALADGNTISAGGNGIVVTQFSFARIAHNTIQDNGGSGIIVSENSSARIGFVSTNDTNASPNAIQQNDNNGIIVSRSSSARIVGNTIKNNGRDGVGVHRNSHADIAANTIEGNGKDSGRHGIIVTDNSGVNLGEDTTSPEGDFFDEPNSTTDNNGGFGILCALGAYANGRVGTLNGTIGAEFFSGTCIDSLI